jgi:hypothetical protein
MQPLRPRFEAKFVRRGADDCWLWTAARDRYGYGRIGVGGARNIDKAHRVSYRLYVGPIPDGLCVLHRCDNPPCVNPRHLFLGTKGDNQRDMARKGRARGSHPARITSADVPGIRERFARGERQRMIAADYGVTQGYISKVVRGRVQL